MKTIYIKEFIKECNKELKTIKNTCGVEFTQEEIHEIMKKAINKKLERENIIKFY